MERIGRASRRCLFFCEAVSGIVEAEITRILGKNEEINTDSNDSYVVINRNSEGKISLTDKREVIDDQFESMLRMAVDYLPFSREDLQRMDFKLYFKNVVEAIRRNQLAAGNNSEEEIE